MSYYIRNFKMYVHQKLNMCKRNNFNYVNQYESKMFIGTR